MSTLPQPCPALPPLAPPKITGSQGFCHTLCTTFPLFLPDIFALYTWQLQAPSLKIRTLLSSTPLSEKMAKIPSSRGFFFDIFWTLTLTNLYLSSHANKDCRRLRPNKADGVDRGGDGRPRPQTLHMTSKKKFRRLLQNLVQSTAKKEKKVISRRQNLRIFPDILKLLGMTRNSTG